MNEAHEEVADGGTVQGLIEEGVFSVKDGLFQDPLTDVVVERGSRYTEEERQFAQVIQHVLDRLAQGGVRFHELVGKL